MKFISTLIEEPIFKSGESDKIISGKSFKEVIDSVQTKAVFLALHKSSGNKVHAAKLLGINRNTLNNYFKKIPLSDRRKVCRYEQN